MKVIAPVLVGLLLATVALAQTSQPSAGLIHRAGSSATSQPAGAKATPGDIGTFRVVLSLAGVLALIVLMYWASRKLMPRHGFGGGSAAIRVLARTPLSPKHRVVLLQVGRRVLVVAEGTGPQPLSTLCEITDPDEAAALIGQIRGEQAGSKSFAALLNNASEKFRAAEPPTPEPDPLAATHQELDGLTQRVRVMARHFERA